MRKLLIASILINIILFLTGIVFVTKLGGPQYLAFKLSRGDDATGVSAGRADHLAYLDKTLSAGKIVFLGDSITEMVEWHEYFGNANIINRGIGGDNTARILSRVETLALSHPMKVIIHAGINDITTSKPIDIADRYAAIFKTIKRVSPETKIIVQSTMPVNNYVRETKRSNAQIVELNGLLRTVSNAEGAKWIDLYPALADENGNLRSDSTFDGLHLNQTGISRWKAAIESEI